MERPRAFTIFERAMRTKRQFMYLPPETYEACRKAPPWALSLSFEGKNSRGIEMMNLEGDLNLQPDLVDDLQWQQLCSALTGGPTPNEGVITLSDGSVIEYVRFSMHLIDRQGIVLKPGYFYGRVIRIKPERVTKMRRRMVDYLHKAAPEEIVQFAKILRDRRVASVAIGSG